MMMADEDVDDEDEQPICFPAKRNSTVNVVQEDDEMPRRRRRRRRRRRKRRSHISIQNIIYDEFDDVPPLYSDEVGDVDFSEAALVIIDGTPLKIKPHQYYNYGWLVQYARLCRKKCCLQAFSHPGDPSMGGIAIKKYQQVNQNVKLQLRELMKINFKLTGCIINYLTFSAKDLKTRQVRPYQAVLAEYTPYDYLLGLFRDLLDGKILAILSVKGSEEDLAERQAELKKAKKPKKKSFYTK